MDEKKPPSNIIVRMPNWLGDAVMATPVLADLRKNFKFSKITAMCQTNVAGILANDPHLDEIFSYKRPSGWVHRNTHYDIIRPLQMGDYDLGILMTNSFSSAWWFWRGKIAQRIGFAGNMRNCLLTDALPFPQNVEKQHLVRTYKTLLSPLGIPISDTSPRLYVSAEEAKAARTLLEKHGVGPDSILVGINPGAAYGSAKCWLPERFKEVTQKLLENPRLFVVYFGDNASAPLVNDICKGMPDRVINLAAKTNLRQLISLIQSCSIFLTNDSGPMHIASALGTPLLALFGSTSDVKTGPYQGGIVIHKHVECSPCYKRECPIDFKCMTRIEVQEVYNELHDLIGKYNRHD